MRNLSTPHGRLGTRTFTIIKLNPKKLSTPHGRLGTDISGFGRAKKENFQLHTVD